MALTPGHALIQSLNMRQEMVMTPQMIQSMEMLQLPIMELEQRLSQELLENPALEMLDMEEDGADGVNLGQDARELDAGGSDGERDIEEVEVDELEALSDSSLASLDYIDEDWSNVFDEERGGSRTSGDDDEDPRMSVLSNLPSRGVTLQEHLLTQLAYRDLPPRILDLCERLIDLMDDAGYIHVATSEGIAAGSDSIDEEHFDQLQPLADAVMAEGEQAFSLQDVADALDTVQRLDPPGVGARDVRECLLIQIDALLGSYTLEYQLVEKHLDDLAANRLPVIVKSMQCTMDEVKAVTEFVRTLDPHPGFAFSRRDERHIVPDVRIEYDEESGDFVISLNQGSLPPVRVSPDYKSALAQEKRGTPEREFLRERIASAEWIIQAIEQRNRTLQAVTREIVARQRDYFLGNTERPAPLMMQQVADSVCVSMRISRNEEWIDEEKIGVDISTVSRAVREKYADSPRGTICLRDMFTRAVGGGDERLPGSRDASNVQVMDLIKQMIDKEEPGKPLKDAQIVRLLKADGISIARRTVAKYRDIMNIPSYSQRKQY